MKFRAGTVVGTKTVYMFKEVLTESVPGQIYELRIKTEGVSNPKNAMIVLTEALWNKFKAKLHYFEVNNNIITIQLEGSPFAWAALLLFLPQILATLGIVVLFIVIYLLVSEVPSWVYALGALGLILVYVAPSIAKAFTGGSKE